MKVNQLRAGIVLSYATQAVQILSGLLYTPIMLRLLGQSEYGLYQLVQSVVSYLGLLNFGFSSAYIRYYARYRACDDREGIARLNGMFMTIFLVITAVCLICGGVMLCNVQGIFGNGLTAEEIDKAHVLMALMIFNLALSFPGGVYGCYISAHEQFFFQRIINLLQVFFNPFLTLPLLLMGYGSVAMVCVSTFFSIAGFAANVLFSRKKLKMAFSFRHFDFTLLREMFVFTFFIFLNLIIDQINWSVDKFLLGRFSGTVAVAIYGVASTLNGMYISFSTAISGVFTPRINQIVAESNDRHALTNLFIQVGRMQFIILSLAISGFILFGADFILVWAGDGYQTSYYVGLFLLIPATVPLIQNLGIEIQRAVNKHKMRSVVYFFIAIANVGISIPLTKLWGPVGAAVGTAISLFIGNGLFMNIYYHRALYLDIPRFWGEIVKFLPAVLLSSAIGFLLNWMIPSSGNLLMLSAKILCYIVIFGVLMWLIGMNADEKQQVKSFAQKFVGRKS